MAGVKQMLNLKSKRSGRVEKVSFDHALKLMRLQASTGSSGWSIEDKDWEFVKETNEISKRPSTGDGKKAEKQ